MESGTELKRKTRAFRPIGKERSESHGKGSFPVRGRSERSKLRYHSRTALDSRSHMEWTNSQNSREATNTGMSQDSESIYAGNANSARKTDHRGYQTDYSSHDTRT